MGKPTPRPDNEELSQADLSSLALKDMTPAQRAEMRRRYEVFVRAYMNIPEPPPPARKPRKWVPGMKPAMKPGMKA